MPTAKNVMRRLLVASASLLLASVANAQDTTVVIVRRIPAQQDTSVTVRHINPQQREPRPSGAPRYALRPAVFAKDPRLGTMLSTAFPGGGQYYAGATEKGIVLTLLGIGAPIVGFANVSDRHGYYNEPCPMYGTMCGAFDHHGTDWTPAAIGLGVGITAWIYGIATAATDVQHWNQAHGVRFVGGPGRAGIAVALP